MSVCAVLMASPAFAQRKNTGENELVGIKLYDNGLRIVSVYGTPDDIQAVSIGGGAAGGGGAGGPAGGPGGGVGGPGGFKKPGPQGSPGIGFTGDFGDDILRQSVSDMQMGPPKPTGNGGGGSGGGAPAGAPGGMGGGAPKTGGGTAVNAQYTRWVYNRAGCRYAFILDRFNRVVQIEAIGIMNNKVHTRRGVGFGATFAQILKKYQAPESYQINGDTIIVRYLVRDKVAFRLQRLGADKPHVVTGIVVAAGK